MKYYVTIKNNELELIQMLFSISTNYCRVRKTRCELRDVIQSTQLWSLLLADVPLYACFLDFLFPDSSVFLLLGRFSGFNNASQNSCLLRTSECYLFGNSNFVDVLSQKS